jgi:hypothetical protein
MPQPKCAPQWCRSRANSGCLLGQDWTDRQAMFPCWSQGQPTNRSLASTVSTEHITRCIRSVTHVLCCKRSGDGISPGAGPLPIPNKAANQRPAGRGSSPRTRALLLDTLRTRAPIRPAGKSESALHASRVRSCLALTRPNHSPCA